MSDKKNLLFYFWLSIFIIFIDQFTKYLAMVHLNINETFSILSMFNLFLIYNHGAAWGFLKTAGGWQVFTFAAVAVIASIIMSIWIYRIKSNNSLQAFALSIITGGAIGNLIDRLINGYVIDFIQIHYHASYFPVFNVADCAITVGSILLMISFLKQKRITETAASKTQ